MMDRFLPLTECMTSLRNRDQLVLESIHSYGLLSVSQLRDLHFVSDQMTRRWLRTAELRGWVRRSRGVTRGSGRPEDVILLGDVGAKMLSVSRRDYRNVAHQLLVTQFRLLVNGLDHMEVLSAPRLMDDFIPDWVFGLRCKSLNKTLLFFVEVDRGTEALTGRGNSIEGKIQTYTAYFLSEGYQVLEREWSCALTGFRVLFYCETAPRILGIQKLCSDRNFIWCSCVDWIDSLGMGGLSWVSGNHQEKLSILGRLGGSSNVSLP